MSNKLINTRKPIKKIFINYLNNNKKEYVLVIILLIIGIIAGVIFINKSTQMQIEEISTYINGFIEKLKSNSSIDKIALIKEEFMSNIILVLSMWFVGSTVVGMPIVYAILIYKGFCLGYTISSIMLVLESKGIMFSVCAMLLQNIIWIPCLLALGVSGICLYKSIIKDRRRENIKVEITRHTIFCAFILIIMQVSALIEAYISTELLQIINPYL